MRHDGCGGLAAKAELLTGIEGVSSRPVRRIVMLSIICNASSSPPQSASPCNRTSHTPDKHQRRNCCQIEFQLPNASGRSQPRRVGQRGRAIPRFWLARTRDRRAWHGRNPRGYRHRPVGHRQAQHDRLSHDHRLRLPDQSWHAEGGWSDTCVAANPSDLTVALAALDATVRVRGLRGEYAIPFADFLRLPGDAPEQDTMLRRGELLVAIDIPASPEAEHRITPKFATVGPTSSPSSPSRPPWRLTAGR